jgi:hypothetical protein
VGVTEYEARQLLARSRTTDDDQPMLNGFGGAS